MVPSEYLVQLTQSITDALQEHRPGTHDEAQEAILSVAIIVATLMLKFHGGDRFVTADLVDHASRVAVVGLDAMKDEVDRLTIEGN